MASCHRTYGNCIPPHAIPHASHASDSSPHAKGSPVSPPAASSLKRRLIDRVFPQIRQFHKLQRRDMRRRQHHPRRAPRLERLLPPRHAQAPLIPRLQPRKTKMQRRRGQIISRRLRKRQKLRVHPHANRMEPMIPRPRMAAAIPKKTRHGIKAARLQRLAEDIGSVRHIFQRGNFGFVRYPDVATTAKDHASLLGNSRSIAQIPSARFANSRDTCFPCFPCFPLLSWAPLRAPLIRAEIFFPHRGKTLRSRSATPSGSVSARPSLRPEPLGFAPNQFLRN